MKKHLLLPILALFCFPAAAKRYTVYIHQPDPLNINAPSYEFTILSGTTIVLGKDLIISGGSGHYETIWSSPKWEADSIHKTITVKPLATTFYSFKVIDNNGCIAEQSFRVNVIPLLKLECKTTQISCIGQNNGLITLKISGGTPPYKIAWSNGKTSEVLDNLIPGDYTVTVTDNLKQTQIKTITIKEPVLITNSLNISICEGSSYRFSGLELNKSGRYGSSFKTANGCDSIVIINLTVNPVYTKTINASICQGSVYKSASIIRSLAGVYKSVYKTRNGCDSIEILKLAVIPLPEIPVIKQNRDTLRSSSTTGNQWFRNGLELKGETKPTLLISSSGNYKVVVTNSSGCSNSSSIYSAIKTDVPIVQTTNFTCKVFPNPNNGIFTIELDSNKPEMLVMELFTNEGKSIIKQTIEHPSGEQRIQFGRSNLTSGVYNLLVKSGSNTHYQRLIVN